MTDPLDFPLPQTTILKPNATTDHFFPVTAGPSRSENTISVGVGVHYVHIDAQMLSGNINIRLRFLHAGAVLFPIAYTTIAGTGALMAKIVVDTPGAWIAIQGTASASALDTARVGVTIMQAGLT